MANPLIEAVHPGAYLISEARGLRSREVVDIAVSETVVVGQVLGRRAVAATGGARVSVAAAAGNVGDGAVTPDGTAPVAASAIDGVYEVEFLTTGATAQFQVTDPKGIIVGTGAVGTTFNGPIKFAIADDSSHHYTVGDRLLFTVGIEVLTAAASAAEGNTGNGVLTLDASTPVNVSTAQPGLYKAICTAVATNAGTFTVYDPNGNSLGTVTVGGSAFNTQIKFTIADGAEDFALDDEFDITVSIAEVSAFEYLPLNLSGTDGTQNVAGIAMYPVVTGSTARAPITAHVRDAEVRLSDLAWPSGITAAQEAAAIQQLRQLGIICR